MTNANPWCVAWTRENGAAHAAAQWCATADGKKPGDDALQDETACGRFVVLRIGSRRCRPTCPDCREALKRKARS